MWGLGCPLGDLADKGWRWQWARGDVLFEDSRNTLRYARDRMVACVGLDDAVIVETPDAVLVARKDKTQNVKQIVAMLKSDKAQPGFRIARFIVRGAGMTPSTTVPASR